MYYIIIFVIFRENVDLRKNDGDSNSSSPIRLIKIMSKFDIKVFVIKQAESPEEMHTHTDMGLMKGQLTGFVKSKR